MINIDGDGPFKVVAAEDVELYAGGLSSWSVAAVYQERCIELRDDHEPDQQGQYAGATILVQRHHTVTRTFFVLRQTIDDALLEALTSQKNAEEKRLQADKAAEAARAEAEKAEAERKQTAVELLRAEGESDRRVRRIDELAGRNGELREQLRKMENDLAAVRRAIGDRAWNEIVQPVEEAAAG